MIINPTQLITCTTVTTGRVNHIKRAIDCYIKQTYGNRNMVILSQGTAAANAAIESQIKATGRTDILFVSAPATLTLGEMRNLSVELATGQIICQWDDDDYYHPDRLATQYRTLRSDNRNIASAYCNFLKYFATTGELFWCDWSGEPKLTHQFLHGSVMFRKSAFHMYPIFYPVSGQQSVVEEDLNALEKLSWKGNIAPVYTGHEYIYTFHGENVYGLEHHQHALDTRWGKKVMEVDELLGRKDLLESSLREAGLSELIKVRSLSEIAFTFGSVEL